MVKSTEYSLEGIYIMSSILNKKIMIIDDSQFSRMMIFLKLEKEGYTNLSVPETSIEAWDEIANCQLSDDPFDLVITDLNMPGLDGMDLIAKVKGDPLSEKIKMIVISADADKTVIGITKTLGAAAYIVKPFVVHEMLSVVEAVLKDEKIPEIKGMFSDDSADIVRE